MNANTHSIRYEYIAAGSFWDFLCVFRRGPGGGYRVTSAEMPGMLALGDTLDEARANAHEELMHCLRSSEAIDDPLRDWRDALPIGRQRGPQVG